MIAEKKAYIWLFSVLSEKIRCDFKKYERYELDLDSLEVHHDDRIQSPEVGVYCWINYQIDPSGPKRVAAEYKCKSTCESWYTGKIRRELGQMLGLLIKELEKQKQ